MSSLSIQHGGNHYKGRAIQPVEFWANRKWDAFAGSILKYLTRWRDKGGIVDLEKALHFAQIRMELHAAADLPRRENLITINKYVEANNIGHTEDVLFYALDNWIEQGEKGNNRYFEYNTFIKLLEHYIAEVKGNQNGHG